MGYDYENGDKICQPHWLGIKRALAGNSIFNGLGLSLAPPMTVNIASGVGYINGVASTFSGGSFVIADGDATYDRWDMITLSAGGIVSKRQGTPNITPKPIDIMTTEILIGMVYVPYGSNATTKPLITSYIKDFGFASTFSNHTHSGVGPNGGLVPHANLTTIEGVNAVPGTDATQNKHLSHANYKALVDADALDASVNATPAVRTKHVSYDDYIEWNKAIPKLNQYVMIGDMTFPLPQVSSLSTREGYEMLLTGGIQNIDSVSFDFTNIPIPSGAHFDASNVYLKFYVAATFISGIPSFTVTIAGGGGTISFPSGASSCFVKISSTYLTALIAGGSVTATVTGVLGTRIKINKIGFWIYAKRLS